MDGYQCSIHVVFNHLEYIGRQDFPAKRYYFAVHCDPFFLLGRKYDIQHTVRQYDKRQVWCFEALIISHQVDNVGDVSDVCVGVLDPDLQIGLGH